MAIKEIWFQQSGIKCSRHSKPMEWEKRIWHHSFYPQPTSGTQSYEEHCLWTLRSAVWHLCLPSQDQLSSWWQCCQVKSVLQVASPATRTSSRCNCQEAIPLLRGEGSGTLHICCWTAVQHSILAVPAPVAKRSESLRPEIKMLSMPRQSSLWEFQTPARLYAWSHPYRQGTWMGSRSDCANGLGQSFT